jgi:YVTN family beta-propeller protein
VTDGPQSIAVNTYTNRVYVGNGNIPTALSVIDGDTYTVIDTFPLELGFLAGVGLAVNSETDRVYATSPLDDVVVALDGTTGDILDTIAVGSFPVGVGVDAVTNRVYVTNMGDDSISVIDGATNSVISTIAVNSGLNPSAIAVNPLTNRIYVANLNPLATGEGSVSVIDGASEEVMAVLPMDTAQPSGGFVQGLGLDASANRIYVVDGEPTSGPGVLKVIDGATNSVASTIELDPQAEGVATDPQINRLYVTHLSNPGVPGKVSVLGLEGDGDYDGFADGEEVFVGTDATDNCPDNPDDDAWPPDINNDTAVNVLDLSSVGGAPFGKSSGQPGYSGRVDMNADGSINLLDLSTVGGSPFGRRCSQ